MLAFCVGEKKANISRLTSPVIFHLLLELLCEIIGSRTFRYSERRFTKVSSLA